MGVLVPGWCKRLCVYCVFRIGICGLQSVERALTKYSKFITQTYIWLCLLTRHTQFTRARESTVNYWCAIKICLVPRYIFEFPIPSRNILRNAVSLKMTFSLLSVSECLRLSYSPPCPACWAFLLSLPSHLRILFLLFAFHPHFLPHWDVLLERQTMCLLFFIIITSKYT